MPNKYHAQIDLKGEDCILVICPASHEQNGSRLRATMKALGDARIRHIFLADILDACNSGSLMTAIRRGDEWLAQHRNLLANIPVMRWGQIIAHPDYSEKLSIIHHLYASNREARYMIDSVCQDYADIVARRLKKKGKDFDTKALITQSREYIMLEVAGLAIVRELAPYPEIYPGGHFQPDSFSRYDPALRLPSVCPVRFINLKAA